MSSNHSLDRLTDQALLDQFGDLIQRHHLRTASLLRYIDVIDRRKLWAKYGHPSMFDFCVSRHHMSESTAFKRIGAARTARRFPLLFEMVGRGELHLSGIHRLKAHLTRENHEQVLAEAKHRTLRQIEKLVARLAPQPDVPSRLRALPNRTATAPNPAAPALTADAPAAPAPAAMTLAPAAASMAPHAASGSTAMALAATAAGVAPHAATSSTAVGLAQPDLIAPARVAGPATPALPAAGAIESALLTAQSKPAPARRDPDPVPLSPGRYKLQVTIGESTYDKLKQLQDLLAHKIPNGDPAVIVARAIELLFAQVRKKKTGLTDKPRARRPSSTHSPTKPRTRHVEAAVLREVWPRDEGRCGFVGADGHRCNETRGLEVAHVQPWAQGGPNTAENLVLRCPAHNAFEADRDYGAGFMARKRKQKPLEVREPIARYFLRGECGSVRAALEHHDPPGQVMLSRETKNVLGG